MYDNKQSGYYTPDDWNVPYSGNLLREEIFANPAILLSEEIFAIFDFNLLGNFCDYSELRQIQFANS